MKVGVTVSGPMVERLTAAESDFIWGTGTIRAKVKFIHGRRARQKNPKRARLKMVVNKFNYARCEDC